MGTHKMTDRPPRPDGGWQAVLEQSCVSVRASTVKHNRKIDATIPGRPAPPHPPCQGCWVEESKLPLAFQMPFPWTLLWLPYVLAHSVFNRNQMKRQLRSGQHPRPSPSPRKWQLGTGICPPSLLTGTSSGSVSYSWALGASFSCCQQGPSRPAPGVSNGRSPSLQFGPFSVLMGAWSHYAVDVGLFLLIIYLLFCVYLVS